MSCSASNSLEIVAFLSLPVGTSQKNARKLIMFFEAQGFCFEFPAEIL